ncbi:MAG: ATP-binding cassette domain-containing protein [Myxococcales bacterium]|nr:ATP-binding cassette domain-containing protein [Myxococcales bacterium]
MIVVDGLAKRFGNVAALRSISFSAANGQITGLLGPNGAGKSTTLRALYTVLKPDSGRAHIDTINVIENPLAARSRIGILPHGVGLSQHLTGRANIRYFGRLQGLNGPSLEERIEQLIQQLDIHSFADRKAKGYSQGQKTKVALAQALVHEPPNVILDEPTNGLDVMTTRALREEILTLKQTGKCVLFSSHVMQEVAAVCDEIVILAAGLVAACGTPDQLREQFGHDDLEEVFVAAIRSVGEPQT